jgi:hypothetical protein
MTFENRNEMKVKIEDLQREYRLLEDGKLLVMFDAAPGVNQGSSISARKQSISSEIDSIELFLRRPPPGLVYHLQPPGAQDAP